MIKTEGLEEFIRRIDDEPIGSLIRENRDFCHLDLADDTQISEMRGHIDSPGPAKMYVDPYWIIRICAYPKTADEQVTYHLLSTEVITSDVQIVDQEKLLVRTTNSIYAIGEHGGLDVPLGVKFRVCAGLHYWGVGQVLGVPHVFY